MNEWLYVTIYFFIDSQGEKIKLSALSPNSSHMDILGSDTCLSFSLCYFLSFGEFSPQLSIQINCQLNRHTSAPEKTEEVWLPKLSRAQASGLVLWCQLVISLWPGCCLSLEHTLNHIWKGIYRKRNYRVFYICLVVSSQLCVMCVHTYFFSDILEMMLPTLSTLQN